MAKIEKFDIFRGKFSKSIPKPKMADLTRATKFDPDPSLQKSGAKFKK